MNNKNKTEIMILGTLHGLHKMNSSYTYDDVFKIIDQYKPDAIAVEIRPEDIQCDREYLSKIYPYEMIETKVRYAGKIPVYGFDWLGDDIKDKPVPNDYFKNHTVKKLENEFETLTSPEKAEFEELDNTRMKLVAEGTASQCNDGRYDASSEEYYARFAQSFTGTKFQPIIDLYRKRDEIIGINIIKIIEDNPGKKIIFLMGMDHRAFALKNIRARYGDSITIKEV
ncbi:MAG: hypothetical protein KKD38_05980 [Candidatus Delongbacteria bacterium]|nr:hypothetical protein [Candidatus Delongbacteria bacterium]MCG2760694.1 hypothetical protein [Candidatus Delongbacteria bacterium]